MCLILKICIPVLQSIQILAIVEDIPESNWNLGLILSKLKLEEVNYYKNFDLKCANSVLGLSTHSGKYACLYCTGLCSLISEDCRTFGSLDYWAQKYKDDGCPHTKMSNYYNVINKRLICLDENLES